MDVFVARQPILDRDQTLHAYELLFRPSATADAAGPMSGEHMASRVILDAVSNIGLDRLVGDRPAFVNVTREVLLAEIVEVLPPNGTVIEILETVEPDAEVVAAVRRLRDLGYRIALDDFVYHPRFHALLELADVVKLDVLDADPARVERVARVLRPFQVELLAERVETHAVFHRYQQLGFEWFQGYYFARPQTVKGQAIASDQLTALRLLRVLNDPNADFHAIESIISADVPLSYKLLRYINSPLMGVRAGVNSIQEALVLLGVDKLRRWGSLVVFAAAGRDKPLALVREAQLRARLCEQLAPALGLREATAFTVGLFSLLDALLDQPMARALAPLALAEDVAAALLGGEGPLGDLLHLVVAWERADWAAVQRYSAALRLPADRVQRAAVEAGAWVDALDRTA